MPIPSYLLALAVGNLESRPLGPISAVWSEPEMVEAGEYEFAGVCRDGAVAVRMQCMSFIAPLACFRSQPWCAAWLWWGGRFQASLPDHAFGGCCLLASTQLLLLSPPFFTLPLTILLTSPRNPKVSGSCRGAGRTLPVGPLRPAAAAPQLLLRRHGKPVRPPAAAAVPLLHRHEPFLHLLLGGWLQQAPGPTRPHPTPPIPTPLPSPAAPDFSLSSSSAPCSCLTFVTVSSSARQKLQKPVRLFHMGKCVALAWL
jgi:hypothetical protein